MNGRSGFHGLLQTIALLAILSSPMTCWSGDETDAEGIRFFESKIRPVLVDQCYGCHSAKSVEQKKLRGGLRLDQKDLAMAGGDSGAVIVPGKPNESLLISALRFQDLEMPPKGALPKSVVADFVRWIELGAPWPKDKATNGAQASKLRDFAYWRQHHWAWKPIQNPAPPMLEGDNWSENAIDRFVLSRLREKRLSPSPSAERALLFRRLHLDLLGIPPTYKQVEAFLQDRRPDSYERAVDRLLASPAFGEKWGRHWLDVARYADNGGFNSQTKELYTDFPYAYTYRDYVVRSLNADLPYNRFLMEQIAADKLQLGEDNRALAALGFLTLGDKSFGTSQADRIDDCIDTVTRGIMGITVSCARCHDHKYDPIPTADYYSLFSVFKNSKIDIASRLHTRQKSEVLPLIYASVEERDRHTSILKESQARLSTVEDDCLAQVDQHLRERMADYMLVATSLRFVTHRIGLDRGLIKRWREFLKKSANSKDSLFAAWHALAKLPATAGPQDLKKKIDDLSKQKDLAACGIILSELQKKPPQSLKDVALAYQSAAAAAFEGKFPGAGGPSVSALRKLIANKEFPPAMARNAKLDLSIHSRKDELKNAREKLTQIKFKHPRAVALTDNGSIAEGKIYIRGNPSKKGKSVPRQFLALLSESRQPFTDGSGRKSLAEAIASKDNPLTARVIANRIWHHYFGRGLVNSPSDFGVRSDPPSHPQLLDYLAFQLIENDWSLKGLHRQIVMSHTYRQSSQLREDGATVDVGNRFLWRMNRKRLDFESMRDSLLAASDELDRRMGGEPVDAWKSNRRTLYGYVNRYRMAPGYLTFDFPSPLRTSAKRSQTLVPQQSLFLMNAPFVQERALRIGEAVSKSEHNEQEQVQAVYRRVLGRSAGADEEKAAIAFVASQQPDLNSKHAHQRLAHALFLSNEFIYID